MALCYIDFSLHNTVNYLYDTIYIGIYFYSDSTRAKFIPFQYFKREKCKTCGTVEVVNMRFFSVQPSLYFYMYTWGHQGKESGQNITIQNFTLLCTTLFGFCHMI